MKTVVIEEQQAAQYGLTFEQWRSKGGELNDLYEKNQRAERHPYHGIADADVDLLHKYQEWSAGVFVG